MDIQSVFVQCICQIGCNKHCQDTFNTSSISVLSDKAVTNRESKIFNLNPIRAFKTHSVSHCMNIRIYLAFKMYTLFFIFGHIIVIDDLNIWNISHWKQNDKYACWRLFENVEVNTYIVAKLLPMRGSHSLSGCCVSLLPDAMSAFCGCQSTHFTSAPWPGHTHYTYHQEANMRTHLSVTFA